MKQFARIVLLTAILGYSALVADTGDGSQSANRDYAASISQLTTTIESFIANDLVKGAGLAEFPPARHYMMFDLDGDKKDDLFLVTTFSLPNGGNHEESHLFVVLSSHPKEVQHLVIGGRGWKIVERFSTDHGHPFLFLVFSVWAKSDAQCCPSLTSTEQIVLENGKIRLLGFDEIKRKPPGW